MACDIQQFDILTKVDSDEPLQPSFKLGHYKWCLVTSLTIIEYSSDKQRLWSDCAYAQADLRLCWLHIPHCWKSHALVQLKQRTCNGLAVLGPTVDLAEIEITGCSVCALLHEHVVFLNLTTAYTHTACLSFFQLVYSTNKVSEVAKTRNRYNQVPHLTQDTTWESDKTQLTIFLFIC